MTEKKNPIVEAAVHAFVLALALHTMRSVLKDAEKRGMIEKRDNLFMVAIAGGVALFVLCLLTYLFIIVL